MIKMEVNEAKERFNKLVDRFKKADEYYKKLERGEQKVSQEGEKKAYITLLEILHDISHLTIFLESEGVKITSEEFQNGFEIKGG